MVGLTALVKVATVFPPGLTATVAVAVPRLLLISNAGEGCVLTCANPTFAGPPIGGRVSVIVNGWAGANSAGLQETLGASAACTVTRVTGVPAMLKSKLIPSRALLPATLQILIVPMQAVTALLSRVTAPFSA